MKKIIVLLLCFYTVAASAQGINFQGVARGANGTIIANSRISLRFSILAKTIDGTPEYIETRTVNTNAQGVFSVVVGDSSNYATTGSFKNITWKEGFKFLKVEMDPAGGTNYISMGTTQLQFVPYSFYTAGVDAANVNGILSVTKGGTGVSSLNDLKTVLGTEWIFKNFTDSLQSFKIGTNALINNKTGRQNHALGIGAMGNNTTGSNNTAYGFSALGNSTTGIDNTAIGNSALVANTTGSSNVAVGPWALFSNKTTNSNAAMGHFALFNNIGSSNVAIGIDALRANVTGNNNTAIGTAVGDSLVDGSGNIIIGSNAGNNTAYKSINNKLIIANSGTASPLIFGSFDTSYITINGDLKVTGKINGTSSLKPFVDKAYNVTLGATALMNIVNDYGGGNVAIGQNALNKLDSGSNNIAIGTNTLTKMIKGGGGQGSENIAIGSSALNLSTGNGNVAVGTQTLQSTTNAYWNVAVGSHVMRSLINGSNNVGVGYGSMINAAGNASNNTIIGYDAGQNITSNENTALGSLSMSATTSGSGNVALGALAMNANKTGSANIAIGNKSLVAAVNTSSNIAIGQFAMYNDTTSNGTIAIGQNALYNNALSGNTAIGNNAMQLNTTGGGNTAIGSGALQRSVTASGNTAIGLNALNNSTTTGNTAIGSEALYRNTTGAYNTAIGGWVMNLNTTGANNVAVGHRNLINNTTGSQNTSIGEAAMTSNTTGGSNVSIGYNTLTTNTTGTNNIGIGTGANVASANLNNAIAIGNQAVVTASNTIQLGNNDIVSVKTNGIISSNKGFLPPRISSDSRDSILSPATGLTIFCNNCGVKGQMQYFDGTAWVNMMGNTANTPLTVGSLYGGGVIAYILQPGDPGYDANLLHGLIAATADINGGAAWIDAGAGYSATGAVATAIGTGLANTNTIINNQGAGTYAAKICHDYSDGTYHDWYLPSEEELNKLYLNRVAIGGLGGTSTVSRPYWSSTDYTPQPPSVVSAGARYIEFGNGAHNGGDKRSVINVRAVRSF